MISDAISQRDSGWSINQDSLIRSILFVTTIVLTILVFLNGIVDTLPPATVYLLFAEAAFIPFAYCILTKLQPDRDDVLMYEGEHFTDELDRLQILDKWWGLKAIHQEGIFLHKFMQGEQETAEKLIEKYIAEYLPKREGRVKDYVKHLRCKFSFNIVDMEELRDSAILLETFVIATQFTKRVEIRSTMTPKSMMRLQPPNATLFTQSEWNQSVSKDVHNKIVAWYRTQLILSVRTLLNGD